MLDQYGFDLNPCRLAIQTINYACYKCYSPTDIVDEHFQIDKISNTNKNVLIICIGMHNMGANILDAQNTFLNVA